MITFEQAQGAIFDLDDTLLSNGPLNNPALWLHSRSRLAAIHAIGEQHSIEALVNTSPEQNGIAFTTASEHSLEGAIWNIFYIQHMVANNTVDRANPLFKLAIEIATKKNELHESILREHGVEVPRASQFIRDISTKLSGNLALATSAVKRDVDIFLTKYDLQEYFPDEHIISAENVSKPKPDPECFDLAFRSLGLPDNARPYVWAFEDNPRGIMSAKAAGLFVCAITTMLDRNDPKLLDAKPDLIADSYEEFRTLLQIPLAPYS